MADVLDCTATSGSAHDVIGLHLGGLFGILALSAVGVSVPLAVASKKLTNVFFLIRALAAGVVLATGLVHVLPSAIEVLENPCLGFSSSYPWAMTFATFAALLTFVMEHCTDLWTKSRVEHACTCAHSHAADDVEAADTKAAVVAETKTKLHYRTIAMTFEIGIIFHSIFIGITFGIETERTTARALMIALMLHQCCEGFALGAMLVKAQYARLRSCLLAAAFVMVTPLGIAIGMAASSSYKPQSKLALGFQGGFDSVSAGILLYNAVADLLLPTFSVDEAPSRWSVKILGFVSLFVGAGIMCVLGKWA